MSRILRFAQDDISLGAEMSEDFRQVQKVIVLGGGSAGFMAALAFKTQMPDLPVTVIRSKDIGIIGVGEGSTTALASFLHQFLRVDPKKFFEITDPTWKLGLKFVWGPRPHFFYSFDAARFIARYPELKKPISFYCEEDMENAEPMTALMAASKVFERGPNGDPKFNTAFSYHIENDKYVAFLEGAAAAAGVRLVEDTVRQVLQDESGVTGLMLASGATES